MKKWVRRRLLDAFCPRLLLRSGDLDRCCWLGLVERGAGSRLLGSLGLLGRAPLGRAPLGRVLLGRRGRALLLREELLARARRSPRLCCSWADLR